ncbi:acylphosphatase [Terasakiella sp.]|uniref:acylphosphatase n=1 Tax=Terasakiella sp. TaxID=2034861 RepID=UPI003AA89457
MTKTYHLKITGRVQGVWYRAWTRETALTLEIDGWVRNRMDGSVEALIHGEEDKLTKLIELCRKGPPAAKVDDVIVTPCDETVTPGFIQERTL